MATRIRTLDAIVAATYTVPPNAIVTLTSDADATALISAGRAVAVADATTCSALFGTARWMAVPVGTGAIG